MDKRGLGRGLAALIGQNSAEGSEVEQIDLDCVIPNPYQPRTQFDPAALAELELSIKEHGVLQPVLLHNAGDGKYQIVAGERRVKAAKQEGMTTIPALVKSYTDKEMIETALSHLAAPGRVEKALSMRLHRECLWQPPVRKRYLLGVCVYGSAHTTRFLHKCL